MKPAEFLGDFGAIALSRIEENAIQMKRQRFENIWDAIEDSPAEAANMKARAELMIAISDRVKSWKLTQAGAAKRLKLTQPRMNDLIRGRIDKFSLDALVNIAFSAGLTVSMHIGRKAA